MSRTLILASGAPPVPPAAPVIALGTTFTIGATITWSAVAGATAYDAYRDGVLATSGVTSPYTILAADVGPAWTLKARNAAVSSAASNALQYSPGVLLASGDAWHDMRAAAAVPNTIVGSKYSVLADQSGNGNDAEQGTDAVRPAVTTEPLLNDLTVASFNGVDSLMTVTAMKRPVFHALLLRTLVSAHNQYIVVGYGASFVPCIRNSNINSGQGYGATEKSTTFFVTDATTDQYYRLVTLTDNGTGTNGVTMNVYDPTCTSVEATASATDAGTRTADGGNLVYGTSFPAKCDIAFALYASAVPSAGQVADLVAYVRNTFVEG